MAGPGPAIHVAIKGPRMDFKASHYNFIWGGIFGLIVAGFVTSNRWWWVAATVAGAVVSYVWSLRDFKDGDPSVKDYLASLHKSKPKE